VDKIGGTNRVRNKVLQRMKRERNKLHTVKRRKVQWIAHILLRNCLLKLVIKGKVEETVRRGIRCKQLPDNMKEPRIHRKLKVEALDRTLCRSRFARGYGPVVKGALRNELPTSQIPGTYTTLYQTKLTNLYRIDIR
jgi:hypothetical protein